MPIELRETVSRPGHPLRAASLLMVFCLATGIVLTPVASAEMYLEDNFESADFELICGGNCPTTSTEYAREGTRSMRSYVNRYTSDNSYRTEARLPKKNKHHKMTFDRDYWIGFSTMLPPGWTHSGGTGIMAQIHHTNDPGEKGGPPPFVIKAGSGHWVVLSRGHRVKTKTYTLDDAYEDVGRWVDWVIHYRPSKTYNGVLRVWKDGALVVNQTGRSTAFDNIRGPRFSMGIYLPWRERDCCNDIPAEKVVYHDALRMASGPVAGYEDVVPRSSAAEQLEEVEAVLPLTPTDLDARSASIGAAWCALPEARRFFQ